MHSYFCFRIRRSLRTRAESNGHLDDLDEKGEEEDGVLYIVRRFRETFGGDRKIAIRVLESTWTDEAVQGQLISAVKELRYVEGNE